MKNIVEMNHITKTFPGIVANDDVSISLREGEILAILGENGAGKSTIMSILFGMYQPDKGEIRIKGQPVTIHNPRVATQHKIGMVHQHFKLVENFTVTENIILGVETTRKGSIDLSIAREDIVRLSQLYNLNVNPDAKIEDISVGMQQRVEILKLLYRESDVMIFDEPTAVLTPQEIDELMDIMKRLQSEGKSIIFITHKLVEIKKVADRVAILRKGILIDTVDVADVTIESMSEMMVGRKVNLIIDKRQNVSQEAILEVSKMSVASAHGSFDALKDVSFEVRKGEILSIAGIEGNGQRELVHGITGLMPVLKGSIVLDGVEMQSKSIRFRNTHGLTHIPEDRQRDGLVLDYNLGYNLALKKYFTPAFNKHGFINFDSFTKHAERLIEAYDIRTSKGPQTTVRSMSGGNQQKAILAREIDLGQNLLIAVQPTRGLDVGAIETIHNQLIKERDQGKGILLVSYELSEIMNISDRILVIHEGEFVGEFKPEQITQQELGLYMAGAKRSTDHEAAHA